MADMMRGAPVALDEPLPKAGLSKETLMVELKALKSADVKPSEGLTFAYVYTPSETSTHVRTRLPTSPPRLSIGGNCTRLHFSLPSGNHFGLCRKLRTRRPQCSVI